jgi:hypothetical protein
MLGLAPTDRPGNACPAEDPTTPPCRTGVGHWLQIPQ